MQLSLMHRRFTKHLNQLVLVLVLLLIPVAILEDGATSRLKARNRRDWLFAQEDFDVSAAGHVTIAAAGVDNTQLQNNRLIFTDGNAIEEFELDNELTTATKYRVLIASTLLRSMILVATYCLALIIQGTVALVRLMSMSVPIFLILILLLMEQLIRHWIKLGMVTSISS